MHVLKPGWQKRIIIRERYNTTFDSYDQLYIGEQFEKYSFVIPYVKPVGTILDDGCGTGLLLEYLVMKRKHVHIKYYVCLDIASNMLTVARKRAKRLGIDAHVEFVEADAQNLPLRSKSIDNTYSFTVFTLLDNPNEGVEEAIRVTRCQLAYTLLSKAMNRQLTSIRYGRYIGSTSKDHCYIVRIGVCEAPGQHHPH